MTVEGNREGYSDRQVARVNEARKLFHIVGIPGVENFKYAIRQNLIKDCPVTVKDVDLAARIYGEKDIAALRGKETDESELYTRSILFEVFK